MTISAFTKMFALLLIFTFGSSCQQPGVDPEAPTESISNFAVRMEVEPGTPGSMQYANPPESAHGVWFGVPQTFQLSYAGMSVGSRGELFIAFEIVKQEKIAFSDLTEANIGNHMAIEIDGEVICAPIVNDRLPGVGVIDGFAKEGGTDYAKDLVYSLKTGGKKRR